MIGFLLPNFVSFLHHPNTYLNNFNHYTSTFINFTQVPNLTKNSDATFQVSNLTIKHLQLKKLSHIKHIAKSTNLFTFQFQQQNTSSNTTYYIKHIKHNTHTTNIYIAISTPMFTFQYHCQQNNIRNTIHKHTNDKYITSQNQHNCSHFNTTDKLTTRNTIHQYTRQIYTSQNQHNCSHLNTTN